jgi:hypothetical protein
MVLVYPGIWQSRYEAPLSFPVVEFTSADTFASFSAGERSYRDPQCPAPERGVDFISVTENIDTTTPGGKLMFHLMGTLAEFERDLRRPRTNAGLAAARARGRIGGRPKRLATNGKVALARQLFADPNHSLSEICSILEISRSTLYRYVKSSEPPE